MNAVTTIRPPQNAIRTAQSQLSETSLEALPLAKMSLATLLDQPDREVITAQAQQLVTANSPATEMEIGKVIFELLSMYESFERRTEASKTLVVNQWRKSLAGWPVDVLEGASQRWINSDKASFVPQPGDVIKHCETIGLFRRALAKKAADFLAMAGRS